MKRGGESEIRVTCFCFCFFFSFFRLDATLEKISKLYADKILDLNLLFFFVVEVKYNIKYNDTILNS